jgi:hypothetical protein
MERLFVDLEGTEAADFYAAVGLLGRTFINRQVEAQQKIGPGVLSRDLRSALRIPMRSRPSVVIASRRSPSELTDREAAAAWGDEPRDQYGKQVGAVGKMNHVVLLD